MPSLFLAVRVDVSKHLRSMTTFLPKIKVNTAVFDVQLHIYITQVESAETQQNLEPLVTGAPV